jgi:transposase InsO family protein
MRVIIHIDFFSLQGKDFFILIDSHSKWIEVHLMATTTASKTIEIILHWLARYGLPLELVSDNGPQFTATEFKDFLQSNGVKYTLTPPYHPSSNGAAERSVQIVKNGLKKHLLGEQRQVEPKLSTQHQLDNFLLTFCSTPQIITGPYPAELFLKREVRTRFSLLKPDLHKRDHDKPTARLRDFNLNDEVLVRDYTRGKEK